MVVSREPVPHPYSTALTLISATCIHNYLVRASLSEGTTVSRSLLIKRSTELLWENRPGLYDCHHKSIATTTTHVCIRRTTWHPPKHIKISDPQQSCQLLHRSHSTTQYSNVTILFHVGYYIDVAPIALSPVHRSFSQTSSETLSDDRRIIEDHC